MQQLSVHRQQYTSEGHTKKRCKESCARSTCRGRWFKAGAHHLYIRDCMFAHTITYAFIIYKPDLKGAYILVDILLSSAVFYILHVYAIYKRKIHRRYARRTQMGSQIWWIQLWSPQLACMLRLYMQYTRDTYTEQKIQGPDLNDNQIQLMIFEDCTLYMRIVYAIYKARCNGDIQPGPILKFKSGW